MDEQECILEIVDGVLTIVPKDKSTSSSVASDTDKIFKQKKKHQHYGKRVYEQMFIIFCLFKWNDHIEKCKRIKLLDLFFFK